ncbi:hypothetical protein [Streptomyces sp. NPDC051662]|uniref:hypothetical protein n=1 Tax=Streptomyces sp. NPDC051662 TaxID=3154750 RepID=UPI00342D4161
MNNKVVLPVSTLASAAVAFGLGALIFTNGNAPGATATPHPTTTVTAPAKAAEKPAEAAEKATGDNVAKSATKTQQAGSKGPFKDAQGDGKYLDDFGKTVIPDGLGVHIPDGVLPWHEPYTEPSQTEEPVTDAEPEADTDASDDVVSGPNVITDPDKPWFDLPTEAPADTTSSAGSSAPSSDTGTTGGPVKNGGLVTGTRPVFNSVADTVSSLLPE